MRVNRFRIFVLLAALLLWTFGINPRFVPKADSSQPQSILSENTLFTVYGRAFGYAPILGKLGSYRSFEDMRKDIRPWIQGIQERNDKKGVIPALHLIYAMAIPCTSNGDCLIYLESIEKDLVETYIEPAARCGWMVVLDTQIGRSTPVEQVRRIIDMGYLEYENVAIALDPEFHIDEGNQMPGTPTGIIHSSQINHVQQLLDDYVQTHNQSKKKILIVHQFRDANVNDGVHPMIQDKKDLEIHDNVDLVIDADGFGEPVLKVKKYNGMTNSQVYPFIKFRGIKIFFQNPWDKREHFDKPPMDLNQIFGLEPVKAEIQMENKPDVIIIA
jgi:hypothetical protein